MHKAFASIKKDGFIDLDDQFFHNKWIRRGDKIVVTSGNDRGKVGEVLSRDKNRVIVRGINVRKKHQKKDSPQSVGIIELEMPIHVTNVSLSNNEGKPVRIKARIVDGKKELYYMDGKKEVVHRQI